MIRSVALALTLALALLGASTFAASCAPGHGSLDARTADLSGPVTVGQVTEPLSGRPVQLPAGWVEQEFFASGTASAFKAGSTPVDGRWSVSPSGSAAYRTRIVVRRPTDPARFNGTVVVEWLNVSAGESSPDWDYLNPLLTSAGYAYVGVSTQSLGVNGGQALLATGRSGGLVGSDPARYGSLHHPGDRYSFDIFAQVGRALRRHANPAVLGGLRVKHIVGVGESQSAFYLTTFADAVQTRTGAFDGLFIHSRGGAGAPLSGSSIQGSLNGAQRIRTDLNVPVFMFETETDATLLGFTPSRQPDTSRIRTWEVAGTAHADSYIVGGYARALGCTKPINDGPQHEVVQAAFAAFDRWVSTGTPPPSPAPFVLASPNPVQLARDANGNVIGGVRTPAVDVPVSTLTGVAAPGTSVLCSLFGSSTPFRPPRLTELYGSPGGYLSRFEKSLDAAIRGGYILPADRAGLVERAGQVRFR